MRSLDGEGSETPVFISFGQPKYSNIVPFRRACQRCYGIFSRATSLSSSTTRGPCRSPSMFEGDFTPVCRWWHGMALQCLSESDLFGHEFQVTETWSAPCKRPQTCSWSHFPDLDLLFSSITMSIYHSSFHNDALRQSYPLRRCGFGRSRRSCAPGSLR